MKPVSRLAIAAVLALGVVAQPAVAQKKTEAPAKGPTLSKEFRAAAQPVQKAMTAKDFATAKASLAAAQAAL